MQRKKFQEGNARNKYLKMLMVISLALLIILQLAWLRSEFRSAAGSFRRETNMVFRNTIMQIAESHFMAHLENFSETNRRIEFRNRNASGWIEIVQQQKESKAEVDKNLDTIAKATLDRSPQAGEIDSIIVRFSRLGNNHPGDDVEDNHESRQQRGFGLLPDIFVQKIDPDTIQIAYRDALHYRFRNLPFQIIYKQVNWREMDWNRHGRNTNDTLPFATGFYPLGPNHFYAASFDGVKAFLLIELLPQIGFSIITTGLIIGLFILTLRNLKAQQRLIDQKNDFIGNMTHELKTPVSTVGVALEALKHFDVLKNQKKAEEYVDMAIHELERLSLMTDKILKTSIYDYKTEIENNKAVVNLRSLALKVYGSFKLTAEKNKIDFELKCSDEAWVLGHGEHLMQMIYNLVDNAFKYAGSKTRIYISVLQEGENVELIVSDNGPGIAAEHHRKIFEKFYRVPSGNVHTIKGYGLGLCYVDGVATSHGGKVSLESQPGKGATFTVTLPGFSTHG